MAIRKELDSKENPGTGKRGRGRTGNEGNQSEAKKRVTVTSACDVVRWLHGLVHELT